jgi:hypothetical protein
MTENANLGRKLMASSPRRIKISYQHHVKKSSNDVDNHGKEWAKSFLGVGVGVEKV